MAEQVAHRRGIRVAIEKGTHSGWVSRVGGGRLRSDGGQFIALARQGARCERRCQ